MSRELVPRGKPAGRHRAPRPESREPTGNRLWGVGAESRYVGVREVSGLKAGSGSPGDAVAQHLFATIRGVLPETEAPAQISGKSRICPLGAGGASLVSRDIGPHSRDSSFSSVSQIACKSRSDVGAGGRPRRVDEWHIAKPFPNRSRRSTSWFRQRLGISSRPSASPISPLRII
jgi:hypothetical protein